MALDDDYRDDYDDDDDDDDDVSAGRVLVMASASCERSETRRARGGGQRVMMLPAVRNNIRYMIILL